VGGLIQKIVDTLTAEAAESGDESNNTRQDYSEYELWWEEENKV